MKAIAAMDLNRGIGYHGTMPWHIPEDFKWFKSLTMGNFLLMGHTTFIGLGKPLPKRHTFVMTKDQEKWKLNEKELYSYVNPDWLTNWLQHRPVADTNRLWLCGGAKMYQQFLPLCDELFMTHVLDEYEVDSYMPPFEDLFPNSAVVREEKNFWIVRYWK